MKAGVDAAAADAAAAPLATLDELSARGPSEAPMMRELERVPDAAHAREIRVESDGCYRAAFSANQPVRGSFVDGTGSPRGDVASAVAGSVPPQGPACAKRGETLRLVFEASGGTNAASASSVLDVRAVVWSSP